MNYFLKRLGCKEDRVSVGLHRLSITLIIWLWITLVIRLIIFQYRPHLIAEVCVLTILLYLFFLVIALIIARVRYGRFRQGIAVQENNFPKRKIYFFFSLKQMGIKTNAFFYFLQGLAAGCAIIIPIPFIFFLVNTCYECFKDMNNLSEEEMKMWDGIQDIGFVTHPSEVISGVAFMVMIGFFIYFTLLLAIWVLSGCLYGKITDIKVSDNLQ